MDTSRYEKQNNLRTDSPKSKLRTCRSLKSYYLLLIVLYVMLWCHYIHIVYIHVSCGHKIKCNYEVSAGQKLTPLSFSRE